MIRRSVRWPYLYAGGGCVVVLLLLAGLGARGFRTNSRSTILLLRQAAAAIERKDLPVACRLLDEILDREPANLKALLFRGEVARDQGHTALAAEYWSAIPDTFPREAAVARHFEGMLAYSAFRARDAEPLFLRSRELNPQYLAPRERLAHLYKLQLRDGELRRELFGIRELRPLSLEELSRTVGNLGKIHPAPVRVSDLEQLIKADPHDVNSFVALAVSHLAEFRFQEAAQLLEPAIAHNPDEPSLRGLLAETLLKQNNLDGAAKLLKNAPLREETSVWLWRAYGDYHMARGDWDDAARCFERAALLDPNDVPTTYSYGLSLERGLHHDAASRIFGRARLLDQLSLQAPRIRTNDPSATQVLFPIVIDIGRLLIELGRLSEAKIWLEQALEWNQSDRQALALYSSAGQRTEHPQTIGRQPDVANNASPPSPADSKDVATWSPPDHRTHLSSRSPATERRDLPKLQFSDRHAQAGLEMQFFKGESGFKYILETTGGGAGVLDFDGDGWPDLYFPQGCQLPYDNADLAHTDRLFRNEGNGLFSDVTDRALVPDNQYSQGCAAADYDNDGFTDLAVANFGTNVIYRNNGDGTFADVTELCGVVGEHWTTSLGWGDLDCDGTLDLVVVNYVLNPFQLCYKGLGKSVAATCNPRAFQAEDDVLYLGRGDGTFENATQAAGFIGSDGRGLGIVIADFDDDGWPDIYIANDGSPNFLFHNETPHSGGSLHLVERGLSSGAAVNSQGSAQAGMGIACGDFDGDLLLDLITTNFYLESTTLYQNQGNLQFIDATRSARLDEPTRRLLGFGTQAIDVDLDGRLDLFIANGHIDDFSDRGEPWKMEPLLLYNLGRATFTNVSPTCGAYFAGKYLGRGVARLDWNRDGLPDLVVVHQDHPAAVLCNETHPAGGRLILDLHGVESNREAIGARITLTSGGSTRIHEIAGSDGFMASNEHRVILGLGSVATVERLDIRWPSGRVDHWTEIPADSELTLIEGRLPIIRRPR